MAEEDKVRLRFSGPWPTWRIIVRPLTKLEDECRSRNFYDLAHVTQNGADYTLFFKLKPEHAHTTGEHVVLKEASHAP